jgi:hypothetical protein
MEPTEAEVLQGVLDLLILKVIAIEPIHGYGIPDDRAVRENDRWASEGYNLGVAKIDSSDVAWGYSLGPIDCHRG